MIDCLPSSPGYSCVSRTDWMISLILRSRVLVVGGSSSMPDQLLGNGRRAARMARQRVTECGQNGRRIEAGVRPEGLVLGTGRGIEDDRWDVRVGQDAAVLGAEGRQLDLAGAVEKDGLLVVLDLLERHLRIVEVLAVRRVQLDRTDEGHGAQNEERPEQEEREDERDPVARAARRAVRAIAVAPTAFSLGKAGLHGGSQDSIARQAAIPTPTAGLRTSTSAAK